MIGRRGFLGLFGIAPAAALMGSGPGDDKKVSPDSECSCDARGAYTFLAPDDETRCLSCRARYTGKFMAIYACAGDEDRKR
jgi:hypothetical protein